MEKYMFVTNFFPVLFLQSVFCVSDFSQVKLLETMQLNRKTQQRLLSTSKTLELTDISLQSSDHFMSAEYMFDFLNKLETGDDIRKASGLMDDDTELENADTVRSFSSRGKLLRRANEMYKFKINSLAVEEKIKRVELRLRHNEEIINRRTKVKYIIKQNKKPIFKYHSKESLNIDGKYVVIDLSKTLKHVLNHLHDNVTIQLSIRQSKASKYSKLAPKNNTETKHDALLIVYSEDKGFMQKMYHQFLQNEHSEQLSRSKRAIKMKKKNKTKGKRKRKICKLKNFDIDFNHLGWGQWVVYPKVFNARICTGVCPSPVADKFTPTNHAMLQSLMRLGQPKAAPMPCCVPTRLKPLKLLYYEKDEIVVRTHENMIAASCGCR